MSDYIKREDALAFQDNLDPVAVVNAHTEGIYAAVKAYDLVVYLNAIPAADVVERKKGEWVEDYNIINDTYHFHCSVCGDEEWGTRKQMEDTHYCPNCGADCRGDNDGEWNPF